jgi:hypothetical protein
MSGIPKWLEEFRRGRPEVAGGNLALLRRIVATARGESLAGVWITPRAAGQLVGLYEQLAPADQELFAAGCNRDFRPWLANLLACVSTSPAAKLLAGLLAAGPGTGVPALHGQPEE